MSFPDTCKRLDAGIDEHLSEYIIRTKAIEELNKFDTNAVVAVGLKGVGKSSTFRYLTEIKRESNEVIIAINPDKFSLYLPNKNLSYTTYRKQFEHDIVIEALRAIVDQEQILKTQVLNVAPLIQKAKTDLKHYLTAVGKFIDRGVGVSVLGFGLSVGKRDSPVLVGLRSETDVRSERDILKEICRAGVKVRIVVDDPEQVFSASRTLDADLVGGFCLAAIYLSNEIPNLKVIALLKTHVYQPVLKTVDDLSRYPEHMIRLKWTPDELLALIDRRIKAEKQKWAQLFEGTESEGKALISNQLYEITRNGPRDLLRILDLGFQRSKSGKVGKPELTAARERASQDSLNELTSAYNSLYPQLDAVLRAIFRDSASTNYTLKELRAHIQTLMVNDHDMKVLSNIKWLQSTSSHALPQLFFEVGALALKSDKKFILPFEEDYTLDQYNKAKSVRLVPALVAAIAN